MKRALQTLVGILGAVLLLGGVNWIKESSGIHFFPDGIIARLFDNGGTAFNVTASGAIGDGNVDDTFAIQAAADKCNANARDGVVEFPAGTFKITSTITFTNCRVRGAGMVNTVIAPTTALAGSPAVVITAPSNGGSLRQGGMEDMQIIGPSAAPTLGLHPSSLVDCLRIDNPMTLERVRVTNCDRGFNENSASGHITYVSAESASNYYSVFKTKQGGSPGTDGGDSSYYDCNFSASFAVIGVANNAVVNGMAAFGGTWGSSPYVMWQEASGGTGAILTTVYFHEVHFENIGNGVIGVGSTAGGAGSINNLTIINPGYVSDVSKRLLTASCQPGTGVPYQCCTGAAAGCDPAYAIDVGGANGTTYLYQGLGSIVGTTGVLRSTSCTGEIKLHRQNAVANNTVVTCDANKAHFTNFGDGHGGWQHNDYTPTDTPVTCVASARGWTYYDLSLEKLCYCDGTQLKWCLVGTSVCNTNASCG